MNPKTVSPQKAVRVAESSCAKERTKQKPIQKEATEERKESLVIGMDLSDRTARYAVLGPKGEDWRAEKKIPLTRESLRRHLEAYAPALVILEVGTHSRWVKQTLEELGLKVFVAHAADIPGIARARNKHDQADARQLARLGRADCGLLVQVQHRSDAAQQDLLLIRARAALVKARTELIVCARGLLKSFGQRVSVSNSDYFAREAMGSLPNTLVERLRGLLETVQELTQQIQSYDHQLEKTARGYPEVAHLTSVPCIGTLTALSFVLTLEDPGRIARSRLAGCVCGLRPRPSQSGESDPQLGIAKTGDGHLRTLLVQCAHHLLGHFGKDCALRRWGSVVSRTRRKQGQEARHHCRRSQSSGIVAPALDDATDLCSIPRWCSRGSGEGRSRTSNPLGTLEKKTI